MTAWQGKAAAGDIARLNELLRAHDGLSVADFCKRVEPALAGDQSTQPASRPQSKPPTADEIVVAQYLNALRETQAEVAKFEEILAQMDRDKKARKVELVAIADAYVGVCSGASNKLSALKAIRQKRNQIASMPSRLERIGQIF